MEGLGGGRGRGGGFHTPLLGAPIRSGMNEESRPSCHPCCRKAVAHAELCCSTLSESVVRLVLSHSVWGFYAHGSA